MYEIDNERIGKHLGELIKKRYPSDRQFGIACLKSKYGEVRQDDIPNIQNRISQIKNGKKSVQIEDLPVFSELLGVSIEDILSGGTVLVPFSTRKTNYSVAFSEDEDDWEEYVNSEDGRFLNADEYNKTIIDYALDAGNYRLLRHLCDQGYIWFAKDNEGSYYPGFSAGTSIKRRFDPRKDDLDYRIFLDQDMRFRMIGLAIKNQDFDMLSKMHARELSELYRKNHILSAGVADPLPTSEALDHMIEEIADSSEATLQYFFEEFSVKSWNTSETYTFIFPFASRLLDKLITEHNPAVIHCLTKAVEHNCSVCTRLHKSIDEFRESYKHAFDGLPGNEKLLDFEI